MKPVRIEVVKDRMARSPIERIALDRLLEAHQAIGKKQDAGAPELDVRLACDIYMAAARCWNSADTEGCLAALARKFAPATLERAREERIEARKIIKFPKETT